MKFLMQNGFQDDMPRKSSQDAPKTAQDAPKMPPRRPQDAPRTPQDGFWLRFGEPTWSHLGYFFGPRRPGGSQDASKRPSWECLGASWRRLGASWRPRPNKNDFGGPLGLILAGFWKVFGRFLGGFWMVFWCEHACTHASV